MREIKTNIVYFTDSFIKIFANYYEKELQSDVILHLKDGHMGSYKFLITASSDVLKEKLRKAASSELVIKDIPCRQMKTILRLVFYGKVILEEEEEEIFSIAKKYKIDAFIEKDFTNEAQMLINKDNDERVSQLEQVTNGAVQQMENVIEDSVKNLDLREFLTTTPKTLLLNDEKSSERVDINKKRKRNTDSNSTDDSDFSINGNGINDTEQMNYVSSEITSNNKGVEMDKSSSINEVPEDNNNAIAENQQNNVDFNDIPLDANNIPLEDSNDIPLATQERSSETASTSNAAPEQLPPINAPAKKNKL